MPAISTLKSSRTREKRALVKENTEAGTLLQAELSDNLPEMLKLNLSIGKLLLNLQTKLARLETANDKLVEALDQTEDTATSEQFQSTLDEENEMIDDCISKISQLKVMKEETEKRRKELESTQTLWLEQRVTQVQEQVDRLNSAHSTPTLSDIWSHTPTETSIKPPKLEIPTFNGDLLKWQEFWDTFEATIDKGKYSSIDKMNDLKSKLTGEALDAILGCQS